MVKNKDFAERLKALGFQLFEIEGHTDSNRTLADVVKSGDLRLWEGFPVMMANSAIAGNFDRGKASAYFTESLDKVHFDHLFAMSLALYKSIGLQFSWADDLYESLSDQEKKSMGLFLNAFKNDEPFKLAKYDMSSKRLKVVFNNYFKYDGSRLSELLLAKEELGLEYALSQIFTSKQKDLFLKKLHGEKFTKTENEYFSRVIKKKVQALANPELHRLAQKVL